MKYFVVAFEKENEQFFLEEISFSEVIMIYDGIYTDKKCIFKVDTRIDKKTHIISNNVSYVYGSVPYYMDLNLEGTSHED